MQNQMVWTCFQNFLFFILFAKLISVKKYFQVSEGNELPEWNVNKIVKSIFEKYGTQKEAETEKLSYEDDEGDENLEEKLEKLKLEMREIQVSESWYHFNHNSW